MRSLVTLGLWLCLATCLALPQATEAKQDAVGPMVNIVAFSISPEVVARGEEIVIDATVVNVSGTSLTNVALIPGVTARSAGAPIWEVVDSTLAGPILELPSGERVTLRVVLRLDADGWHKVGAAVMSDQSFTTPVSDTVRVGGATWLWRNLVVAGSVFFGIGWAGVLSVRWARRGTGLAPARRVLAGGIAALLGAVAVWTLSPNLNALTAWLGMLLFGAGWVCVFGALRPLGRWARGTGLGLITYGLLGACWWVILSVGIQRGVPSTLASSDQAMHIVLWPFDLFQIIALT